MTLDSDLTTAVTSGMGAMIGAQRLEPAQALGSMALHIAVVQAERELIDVAVKMLLASG